MTDFVAIDFETADYWRDSACAVGLVRVERSRVAERAYFLIRPPRRRFAFSWLHGITWADVRDEPTFAELWPEIEEFIDGAGFLVAHNAAFDRGVLTACCETAGVAAPWHPFVCTVRLARAAWGIRPTNLPNVCQHLRIPLNHHHAGSDAEACARIALAARRAGML